jgi:hypothetical protein
MDTLKKDYVVTEDWEGKNYCGIDLEWDYKNRSVILSMKGYVQKALDRFEHTKPKRKQHAPSPWSAPKYGAAVQYAEPEDKSEALSKQGVTRLQEIIGSFLYYARAIDNTMLVALGSLAAAQTEGTQATMKAAIHLLNYAATYPNAEIKFVKSKMILAIHSDASYNSEPKARSRVGGYFFLTDKPNVSPEGITVKPNAPIHVESRIMRNVMASAAEAEIGAMFINGQEGSHMRNTLAEIGHPQVDPTPLTVDNKVAVGFGNEEIKQKRSKAIDMRFYWIQDRIRQGEYTAYWQRGKGNLADYFTKHHPPSHHMQVRSTYLHVAKFIAQPTAEREGVLIQSGTQSSPSQAPVTLTVRELAHSERAVSRANSTGPDTPGAPRLSPESSNAASTN